MPVGSREFTRTTVSVMPSRPKSSWVARGDRLDVFLVEVYVEDLEAIPLSPTLLSLWEYPCIANVKAG